MPEERATMEPAGIRLGLAILSKFGLAASLCDQMTPAYTLHHWSDSCLCWSHIEEWFISSWNSAGVSVNNTWDHPSLA